MTAGHSCDSCGMPALQAFVGTPSAASTWVVHAVRTSWPGPDCAGDQEDPLVAGAVNTLDGLSYSLVGSGAP